MVSGILLGFLVTTMQKGAVYAAAPFYHTYQEHGEVLRSKGKFSLFIPISIASVSMIRGLPYILQREDGPTLPSEHHKAVARWVASASPRPASR